MRRRPFFQRLSSFLLAPKLAIAATKAWRTLEPRDWSRVADLWGKVAADWPAHPPSKLLHARLLRSARRLPEAIEAARMAIAQAPDRGEPWFEYGRAMRAAGRRDAAIAAYVAAIDRGHRRAIAELCRYGGRSFLPTPDPEIAAPTHYAHYAAENSVPPPPPGPPSAIFRIALTGSMEKMRQTRESLSAQTYIHWFEISELPSLPASDLPIFDLALPEGALLDAQALAWLARAIADTRCSMVRADHDHLTPRDARRIDPTLLSMPDRLWAGRPGCQPPLTATSSAADETIAHVPLVLMSLPATGAESESLPDAAPIPLSVVIPSRDNPALLRTAVDTLLATASAPDHIELIIIDNGSRTESARRLLAELAHRPNTIVLPFDEPFNWSRANNLGAASARGDSLLFLNDDTAMQTAGWDRILAGLLSDQAVGVVGARMLYPNRTIQHGGFVFGMDNGPQHEGRWMPDEDAGPGGRWRAIRQAAAVTGAFMATRKSTFLSTDGFDERVFAVDFADVDFCLRLRSRGLAVAYCGAITLIHHESVSRGLNLSRKQRTRMSQEYASLRRRWGSAVDSDPGYHPAWARTGCSYDGLHRLTMDQILTHIRDSVRGDIWDVRAALPNGTSRPR